MSVLVVGSGQPVAALTAALGEEGVEARAHAAGSPAAPSAEALAQALVELEPLVADGVGAIVAVGSGDGATAAALVAGKSGVSLYSVVTAAEADLDETRAVAQLSAEVFELPLDGAAIEQTAEAIVSALSSD